MQQGHGRAALLIVCALMRAAPVHAVSTGEPLSQALEELRRSGLAVIFSSALIEPRFTVKADPGPGAPAQIARRILAPYGLGLKSVGPDLYAVVKLEAPQKAAPTPPAAGGAPQHPGPATLSEIDVYASRYTVGETFSGPQPSTEISRQDLEALPGLYQDAMRATRYLPGVSTSAISARPHVRGGREDEVAIFFDGVPLYEPYHYKDVQALLGTLDPQTIARMSFFTGVFPARYGNRLSGVLDMQPRTWDGANYQALSQSLLYSEALSLGKLDSAPLQWLGAVRVGVVDFVADLLDRNQVEPDFLDALGRVQYQLSEEMSVAAGYLVLDDDVSAKFNSSLALAPPDRDLLSSEQAQIHYRDGTAWLGWKLEPSDTSELRATLSRTERHTERSGSLDRQGSADSTLQDSRHFETTTARVEATTAAGARWKLSSGLEWYDYEAEYRYATHAVFEPRLAAALDRPDQLTLRTNLDVGGQAYAAYASALFALRPNLSLDAGLRWDGERFGIAFRRNQVSPRIALQLTVDPSTVVRASWGRLSQTQRPDELQVEDGDNIFHRAEFAVQSVLSLEHALSDSAQLHVEVFDKQISNPRPRYENLFDPIALLPELEVDRVLIQAASSRMQGAEVSLRWRIAQQWSGWVNYSWSEVTDVIGGVRVPRSWDQKHAAAAGFAWRSTPWLWSVDASWHTGWRRNQLDLVSLDPPQLQLLALNSRTWPAYLSLDTRLTWSHPLPWGAVELFGEIDNVTNHANPCCTDVQFAQGTISPLLEHTTSVWLPRFALVGATWRLP